MTQPDSSASVGLPLPKRFKQVATAMVLSLTGQESKTIASDPLVPKPDGGASGQGGTSLSIPQSKEAAIPIGMAPLHINMGDSKWIYCCWVEECPEGPLTFCATICSHVHQAHLGMKLSSPSCPSTFFKNDALWKHGKQVHLSGTSDPV